jgi:hypothetical protein
MSDRHVQSFLTEVASIEPSDSTTPSTVTASPLANESHDARWKSVLAVVRTVRPSTVKLVVGQVPCSPDIGPETVALVAGAAAWSIVTVWPPTVTEPERVEVVVFSATSNVRVALPEPLAGDVSAIHESPADAVHGHDESDAVSDTLPLTPPAGASTVDGDTENAQVTAAAAWETVTLWPAITSVPVRGEVSELATAEYWTVPLPLPLAPEGIVSHPASLAAVHAQPSPADTLIEPLPPPAPTDSLVLESVNVHGGAAAPCVTVKVSPAIVRVALRSFVLVLGATEY